MNLNFIDPSIFSVFAGLGILVAGIGFAYAQFKMGEGKAKDSLIVTLKEAVDAERDKAARLAEEKSNLMNFHQAQINELNTKLGKLQGLYEASEKSKKEYLEILQGRDPTQKAFMEFMTQTTKSTNEVAVVAAEYMKDTIKILSEVKDFMQALNEKSYGNS